MIRVLSLGAGVQSTALALMAARGETDALDYAVFADTGWEPEAIYRHLDWLEKQLPFPLIRARREGDDLGVHAIAIANGKATRTASPPWFTKDPNGMLPKQCSVEYKTRVVSRAVRKILGFSNTESLPKGVLVEQWLGISIDEMQRMKDSGKRYVKNRFPLIEMRLNRRACLVWMRDRQYPKPEKSACIFCPYHGVEQWRQMRDQQPNDWAKACELDRQIRNGFSGMQGQAFVHRQRVPLSEVDLSNAAEKGQTEFGFLQECEGICGT